MENTEKKEIRKSYVATFTNHPPIRLWGTFEADDERAGKMLGDYEDGTLWNGQPQWGHHDICYYICKSGKRLYWASYNSGECYNGREPQTKRRFLKTTEDIKNYLCGISEAEWNRVGHRVDPTLIVDSDLL